MVGKGCRRNLQKNLDRKNHTIQRRVHHTTQRKEKEGSHATQREEGTTHKGEEEESHHTNGEDHSTQMAGTTPQKRENHTAGRNVDVLGTNDFEKPRRLRRAEVTSVRPQRDWEASEHGVCTTDVADDGGKRYLILQSPKLSNLRRLHANLGHRKNNVLIRHLRH